MKVVRQKLVFVICIVGVFLCGWYLGKCHVTQEQLPAPAAVMDTHVPNQGYEYLVGSSVYQLSAEADALIVQGYAVVMHNVDAMAAKCANPTQADWQLVEKEDGGKEMYCAGKRVAIICDVDDTLVNGVNYTADVLGNDGDWNNAAYARFLMSDGCVALPGAVDCINYCVENGIEVYYLTNRYDQGYKVGQGDSRGSYEQYAAEHGEGTYVSIDGTLIGTSVWQLYGMSMYDITLESMEKLGFPIDDQHLIVNDNKLFGGSKEQARQAITNGCRDYSNGQRAGENSLNTAMTLSCDAHAVVMLLGDQMTDFVDVFDTGGLTAPQRKELTMTFLEKFGTEWIIFPNAVYGRAMDSGMAYGPERLFREFAYTN